MLPCFLLALACERSADEQAGEFGGGAPMPPMGAMQAPMVPGAGADAPTGASDNPQGVGDAAMPPAMSQADDVESMSPSPSPSPQQQPEPPTAGSGADAGEASAEPPWFPCDGDPADYDVTAIKTAGTWTVANAGGELLTTDDMQQAMEAAYGGLSPGRSAKESVLILGSGEVSANAQIRIPGNTIVNLCGTITVVGSATMSDRSPMYARGVRDIDIPHASITGNAQYALFFRDVSRLHLGEIDLQMNVDSSGLGIRIDNNPSAGGPRVTDIRIDHARVEGTGGHGVETYGVDGLVIGRVDGIDTGNSGVLLNDTVNAEVGVVECDGCAHVGTGYAALRIANGAGRIGDAWPAGNIHVGSVHATGGGRGIFCVSGSGGMTIDRFDIDRVGGSPAIFIENCHDVTLAAASGTLTGGEAYLGHNGGNGAPNSDITLQNVTLVDASAREQCQPEGDLGNRAQNVTGGEVDFCHD